MALWKSVAEVCKQQPSSSSTCILLQEQMRHWASKKGAFRRESLAAYEGVAERMNFTGFSCASDRKFKFFAVDPVDMPYFVNQGFKGLGFNGESDPIAFIIDAQVRVVKY